MVNESEPVTSSAAEMPDIEDAEPEGHSAEDPAPKAQNAEDEVKRRFREALERKQEKNTTANAAASGKDSSKAHSTHGPAATRRSFRRKSG